MTVGAKGISCRVSEAIFGRDAIKFIPRVATLSLF